MAEFRKIPCVIQRGGTSKGIYIHEKDLPKDFEMRNRVILSIFGSPDKRQIDGLGGADPLTSKLAIIAPSRRNDADIDYTFGAVDLTQPIIDYRGNCGNISSGVGPFAIDEGLVKATGNQTKVRIFNTNTEKPFWAYVPTENGKTKYLGDYAIDGVPGTSAKILMDYSATAGAATGKLLPTGSPLDVISIPGFGKMEISIVDAANPMGFIEASTLGFSGIEGPLDTKILESLKTIELIRGTVAKMIGLVDDAAKARTESPAIPMLAFVSRPQTYTSFTDGRKIETESIDFVSRVFYMQEMHKTYSATATVCTGAAARIKDTLVHRVCTTRSSDPQTVRFGHPAGSISIEVEVVSDRGKFTLRKAALGRTSRRIMDGFVYVPDSLFRGK